MGERAGEENLVAYAISPAPERAEVLKPGFLGNET